MTKTLAAIYSEHFGKVSDKWTIYLAEYDRIFENYRDKNICLLEVGIQNGGSLEIWSKFFPKAQRIIGCDINSNCAQLAYSDERISVVVGDANSDQIQQQILAKQNEFDIFIDDGSHSSADIIRSFAKYFQCVAEGGVYVVEDIHCSYWKDFNGGLFYPFSSIAFFKRLVDIANYEHWGLSRSRLSSLSGFIAEYALDLDEIQLTKIHSIEFINSLCVIRKCSGHLNVLGVRVIAGQVETIVTGQTKLHSSPHPGVNQETNEWSARSTSPEEELILKQADIQRLEYELSNTGKVLIKLQKDLNLIYNSKSWRLLTVFTKIKAFLRF